MYKRKHWTQTARGRAKMRAIVKARHAKNQIVQRFPREAEVEVVDAVPVDPVHRDHIEHIIDGVWRNLSLSDKAEALSGLYFDPTNPNED